MNILILNYRDLRHPQAGGAEVHLHQIFGRIAAKGHQVTLITTGFTGAPSRDMVDGIQIVRLSGDFTFQFQIALRLRSLIREFQPNILVEDINKLPFFTPLYCRLPKFVQVHHLWKASIFQEAPFPLAAMVWLQERMIPWFYRGLPFAAVSPSTCQELRELGIAAEDIHLIYNGSEPGWFGIEPESQKEDYLLWLGRLRKYKGVWVALEAFRRYTERHGEGRLVFAGGGPEEGRMREAVRNWGLENRIEILGRVEAAEKQKLLRGATALVQSSFKEGWGLTIMEAAACGTISLASRVPGLCDSVVDGKTGWLFKAGDSTELATLMERVFQQPQARRNLEINAREHALTFSWDTAAEQTLKCLQKALPNK